VPTGRTLSLYSCQRQQHFHCNPTEHEVWIVLVGTTGVGKSAAGTTILGRKDFETNASRDCYIRKTEGEVVSHEMSLERHEAGTGSKHLINNGHITRQEQRQQTENKDKKQSMNQQGTELGN
jgi:hypothetical protein